MVNVYKSFFIAVIIHTCAISLYAQQCGVIYVTPTGAGTGVAGTRANPANLAYGLFLVSGSYSRVWLAAGTYNISTTLNVPNNATIEGGFDPVTWVKSNATPSIIHKDASNTLASPAQALIGVSAAFVTNFRLQDLTIQVDAAPGTGYSVYGIYLNGCYNYNIVRCVVTTGAGAPGINGASANNGVAGGNGSNGGPGNDFEVPAPGGAGGTGGSGTNTGGNGAAGGKWNGANNQPGQIGSPGGCGGAGGSTASGPSCCGFIDCEACDCSQIGTGSAGQPGASGANGTNGTAGPAGTINGSGYFTPGTGGGNGTVGTDGCGGGGGGGGGGRQDDGVDDVGGSGGGGGGGVTRGNAGSGGKGGGASFAMFLYNNGASGSIIDCQLTAGPGGAGGVGGTGGTGGAGGTGGLGGGPGPCPNSFGYPGGNGGSGGNGGNGGSGAPGMSANFYETGGTPVTQQNITSVPGNPPVITVSNSGCTNSEVVYTSPSSGNWNFGSGATPATATGAGPVSVIYNAVGRKTITFSGTTFTGFTDIFSVQTAGSGVTHTNNPSVTSCPDTFSTALSGTLYEWNFGTMAQPQTISSTTAQSASTSFTTPGTYTVVVWVTTPCCGRVKDSLTVTILSNTLNISLTASDDTICTGNPVTFTASPTGLLSYNFKVNGLSVQNTSGNVYTSSAFSNGDVVTVTGAANGCPSPPSSGITITVISVPSVILTDSDANDSICEGTPVTFTASPSGYTTYQFYNGGSVVQNTSSVTYTAGNLPVGNSISVVANNAGCVSAPSNVISIAVSSVPVTAAGSNQSSCADAAAVQLAGFSPVGGVWSGAGITNSSGTFDASTAGVGTVTLTYSYTNASGCGSTDSLVYTVTSLPVATTSSTNTICGLSNGTADVDVTSGTAPFDYLWTNAAITDSISSLAAGTYIVTVTDAEGCSATASAVVDTSGSNSIAITADKSIMCSGDSAQICAPAGFVSYLWNNGAATQCIYTKLAGNYYMTATDNGSCTALSNHVAINVYPAVAVSISVNGDTLTAYNAVAYQWYRNSTAIGGATSQVYVVNQGGSYTVQLTDSNGCSAFSNSIVISGIALVGEEVVKVYPNPLENGTWQVECTNSMIGNVIEIFDSKGSMLFKSEIRNPKFAIDLSAPQGIYFLRINAEQKNIIQKLIRL